MKSISIRCNSNGTSNKIGDGGTQIFTAENLAIRLNLIFPTEYYGFAKWVQVKRGDGDYTAISLNSVDSVTNHVLDSSFGVVGTLTIMPMAIGESEEVIEWKEQTYTILPNVTGSPTLPLLPEVGVQLQADILALQEDKMDKDLNAESDNIAVFDENGNAVGSTEKLSDLVHMTGNETVDGVKTFTLIPVLPNSNPILDNQSTRKKYVDDGLATKEPNVTKGNITTSTDSITIGGSPTNSVIGNGVTLNIANATTTMNGQMSAIDKTKLDGISANAKKVETSSTNGNIKIDGVESNVYTLPNTVTSQGNTFNGNSQLVKTTTDGKLPTLDGSNLTGVLDTTKIPTSEKAQALGVATLDENVKIPIAQIPDSLIGGLNYHGTHDASSGNPPTLVGGVNKGDYWIISVAGTINSISYAVGDWIIYDGTTWEKIDNTQDVTSVFGRIGNVVANTGDYTSDQITETVTKVFVSPTEKTAITHTNRTALDAIIGAASSSQNGYLTSTDWNTFNGKQSALGFTPENSVNKENTIMDTSATKFPTNRLSKEYSDTKIAKTTNITAIDESGLVDGESQIALMDKSNKTIKSSLKTIVTTLGTTDTTIPTSKAIVDQKNAVNGICGLGSDGKVQSAQLPVVLDPTNTLIEQNNSADFINEFQGIMSDPLYNQALLFTTGIGTRADGTVYTNPLTFKDVSGMRVREVLGFTLTNLCTNGDFSNGTTGWSSISALIQNESNTLAITTNAQYGGARQTFSTVIGRKYYISAKVYGKTTNYALILGIGATITNVPSNDTWNRLSFIFTATSTSSIFGVQDNAISSWSKYFIDDVVFIDLPTTYGAGNEPTKAQCDVLFGTTLFSNYLSGTQNVVNPKIRSLNSGGTVYSDLTLTGTLRQATDDYTKQDRLYQNSVGKWLIDRVVNSSTGLAQTLATEDAVVSGNLAAYKGGTIQVLTSAIAPKVGIQYVENWGEWNSYTPTLTWTTGTPATNVVSSFKYRKQGKTVRIQGNYKADDGNGATNVTITLPFTAKSYSGVQPMAIASQQKVNTIWTVPIGYIEDNTSLVKFRTFATCTDNQAVEINFSGEYEIA